MSQLDPLPTDLPFRIISKTIGRGAYASIKKAVPLDADTPIFAVKFIHKTYATKQGRISAKQIAMEVSLHSHIGQHANIIEWFATGEDDVWRWIAMEYASGGDLFDKIEADVGVSDTVAQIYFSQLVAGVSFVHSKGVAHRDLKPENILLSEGGDLKIADFGMATMFAYQGQRKMSSTICGSPPYVAPEVLTCARAPRREGRKYDPEQADIWSCGVILFVLLVGNTPWDQPTEESWEFVEYVKTGGHSSDELWQRVPADAQSLLRGMLAIDSSKRFNMQRIRQHPWFSRSNPLMMENGRMKDPLQVATLMLSKLRIDFDKPVPRNGGNASQDAMDTDPVGGISSTQPEPMLQDPFFDFDCRLNTNAPTLGNLSANRISAFSSTRPTTSHNIGGISATQPVGGHGMGVTSGSAREILDSEPGLSQFSQTPGVSLTLTQRARQFRDLVPEQRFTKFLSASPPHHLISLLVDALHNLSVPLPSNLPEPEMSPSAPYVWMVKIRAMDGRKQSMHGEIVVDRYYLGGEFGGELLEVRFLKMKGDPLEWRRFFKRVAVLCRDGVFKPEA
ncbi:Pkinase-domain-containing protein [Zalerion maritima]|uniref:non-specific serine/threonine protein kinase n=1 Tax=Zalerion maritima TaxID=339359 RepID=A0AAD5WTN7_9PEZI|nr:Pkinase-domain-containing protein [Zalerion maritima]